MPVYEYQCESCGERFELRRHIEESNDKLKCPLCGADNPKRIFSSFSTGSSGGSCAPTSPT